MTDPSLRRTSAELWRPYTQMKTAPPALRVERTDGVRIVLDDGRALVDGTSSWWTACHGYNHAHIRRAVEAQLERMPHVMLGGLVHEPAARLARRLARLAPGDVEHVFLSESGSVSVEVAMKIAVQYWLNRGERRTRFVAFEHAYHGDTFAAMSVCDPNEGMHSMFAGAFPPQIVVPLPPNGGDAADLDRCIARHRDEVAAIVLEPLVQAAGGMRFHDPDTLAAVARVAERHGVLLILDEIAVGFGRTGTLFACEQAGVVPDVMTLSKALTGGTLPLAATLVRRHVFDAFWSDEPSHALMHGPTFAGNPLACAAANASLDLFETEPRLAQVERIARQLEDGLAVCRGVDGVRDVRVKGAIGVVELERAGDLDALRARFVDEGVWVRPFGDVVYLMPPFVIGEEDLETLIRAVHTVVAERSS
jgi:adenosylmethionine---8-amino-7-oxononanoate aminotransferase